MNTVATPIPDDTKCGALVTLRIIPEDKAEAYWISERFKCSIARIFRESLWKILDDAAIEQRKGRKPTLIEDFDPLQGKLLLEESDATAMFTLRLTEKEKLDAELLAVSLQCSLSSVFRAGLRMLFPIARAMIKKNHCPSFIK
jgi:hypothetical protein